MIIPTHSAVPWKVRALPDQVGHPEMDS